jgi:hypothetical protein
MFTAFSRTILLLLGYILLIEMFLSGNTDLAPYAFICFLVDILFMSKYRVFFK